MLWSFVNFGIFIVEISAISLRSLLSNFMHIYCMHFSFFRISSFLLQKIFHFLNNFENFMIVSKFHFDKFLIFCKPLAFYSWNVTVIKSLRIWGSDLISVFSLQKCLTFSKSLRIFWYFLKFWLFIAEILHFLEKFKNFVIFSNFGLLIAFFTFSKLLGNYCEFCDLFLNFWSFIVEIFQFF